MNRATVSLLMLALFLGVNFGLRTWVHWRSTGSPGFRGISGRVASPEWFGGVLFAAGIVLGIAAPLAEMAGAIGPTLATRARWVDALAFGAVLGGVAGTSWAQSSMGASWRIGVRQDERTELIERGPFRWVRNPIFSFMLLTAMGLAMLLPNALSLAAFACLFIAVELQVRFAEEPYLRRTHADRYTDYCRRVGRFLPGIGRDRGGALA